MDVSELADEGEQGPKYHAKTSNLNVQPPQKSYGGSFVRGPVRYSPDVPLKINMGFAKVWRKYFFCEDDVFHMKEFRTTPIYTQKLSSSSR